MVAIASPARRGAPDTETARAGPTYPEYERLQSGGDAVSLRRLVGENPMLRYAVIQQINRGVVAIVAIDLVQGSGGIYDVWLARIGHAGDRGGRSLEVDEENPYGDEARGPVYGIFEQ